MIRKKAEADLDLWIAAAGQSLIASFANGIAKDTAIVHAAIQQPWSNGEHGSSALRDYTKISSRLRKTKILTASNGPF